MNRVLGDTFEFGWSVALVAPAFLILFIGIIFFVYQSSRRDNYQKLSELPLDDE